AREGGVDGNPRGEGEGRLERAAALGEDVDEAVLVGDLGVDRVTGQRRLHRQVQGELAAEAEEPATGGDQAPLHLGDAEARILRGDDEVAGTDDLGAAGQRGALDRGDQRLGAV